MADSHKAKAKASKAALDKKIASEAGLRPASKAVGSVPGGPSKLRLDRMASGGRAKKC